MTTPSPRSTSARRAAGALGAGVLIAAGTVLGSAGPAGAIATVTTSGTVVTVTMTGTTTLTLACTGGVTVANGQTGSPSIACNKLTKVIVNGDSASQTVDGKLLENPSFSAKPSLQTDMGPGVDTVTETSRGDLLYLGSGNDNLYLQADTTVNTYELGPDTDFVRYYGNSGAETLVASADSNFITLTRLINGAGANSSIGNAEEISATTFEGNDTIDFGGIVETATLLDTTIYAGEGDDTLIGAQKVNGLHGEGGTNTFTGGSTTDNVFTEGNQDSIDPKAGTNWIYEQTSGRSGRTITSAGTTNWHFTNVGARDSVARIRPGVLNMVTHSLGRPGQQVYPSSYRNLVLYHGTTPGESRAIFDLVALGGGKSVTLDGDGNDLLDVTIPTGSWTNNAADGSGTIAPLAGGYSTISVNDMGAVKVHGPWTNKDQGFVHRVTRDLMFRFATDPVISTTGTNLTNGSTTRQAVVSGLMDTDEYRASTSTGSSCGTSPVRPTRAGGPTGSTA